MSNRTAERLDAIYLSEFGDSLEFVFRQVMILSSTALIVLISQDMIYLWWLVSYYVIDLVLWLVSRPRVAAPGRQRLWTAYLLYVISICTFYLGPIYTIAKVDPFYLWVGTFALIGTGLFLVQRAQPVPELIAADSISFAFGLVGSYLAALPRLDGMAQALSLGLICAATIGYFVKASLGRLHRQQARRLAERRYARAMKARALSQFVGGVAHDFNNLLTAIIGNLELHDVLADPEEKRAALRQSRDSALRAAMTVKQLLASSGRTRLTLRLTDLREFLRQVHLLLQDLLEPGITVEIILPDLPVQARVDREMLETSVIQLCLNAQDAMGNRGVIRLHAVQVASPVDIDPPMAGHPPYVGIMVEDNGPGVAEEALGKLAEPFYTTKPVGDGSGLGLSAVAGFARQSGGGLRLESDSNGLRATILFPAG